MLYVEYMTEAWGDTIQNDANRIFSFIKENRLTAAHRPHPLQPRPTNFLDLYNFYVSVLDGAAALGITAEMWFSQTVDKRWSKVWKHSLLRLDDTGFLNTNTNSDIWWLKKNLTFRYIRWYFSLSQISCGAPCQ